MSNPDHSQVTEDIPTIDIGDHRIFKDFAGLADLLGDHGHEAMATLVQEMRANGIRIAKLNIPTLGPDKESVYIVADEKLGDEVIRNFPRSTVHASLIPVIGASLFALQDTEEYRALRSILVPLLGREKIGLYIDGMVTVTNTSLEEHFKPGVSEVDIKDIAEDIAARNVMVNLTPLINVTEEELEAMIQFIGKGEAFAGMGSLMPNLPEGLTRIFPQMIKTFLNTLIKNSLYKGGQEGFDKDRDSIRKLLLENIDSILLDDVSSPFVESLWEGLDGKTAGAEEQVRIKQTMVDAFLGLFSAGEATTTGAIQSATIALFSNLELKSRLQDEIEAATLGLDNITHETLRKMPVLKNFIDWVVMQAPPTHFLPRGTVKPNGEVMEINGQKLEDSQVWVPIFGYQHNDLAFDPAGDYTDHESWGAGARRCTGEMFAKTEISIYIIQLFKFLKENNADIFPLEPDAKLSKTLSGFAATRPSNTKVTLAMGGVEI